MAEFTDEIVMLEEPEQLPLVPGNELGEAKDVETNRKVYFSRWFILALVATSIAVRGYNQSCFGTINNIYSEYFNVQPWQIDWFGLIQSVCFLALSLPLAVISTEISFRLLICLITGVMSLGLTGTACGLLTRSGYPAVLISQAIMGVSTVLSASIPPLVAAVWFPSNEVAIAVAIQMVARGVGEFVGCFTSPYVVTIEMTAEETKRVLSGMFGGLASIMSILFILSLLLVNSKPPTPPSQAQAIVLNSQKRNSEFSDVFKMFFKSLKSLFKSKSFVIACFVFGASKPLLRTSTILLSSILQNNFVNQTHINQKVGVSLAMGWLAFVIGGLLAGPLIKKTRRYKEVVAFAVFFLLLTCVSTTVGVAYQNMPSVMTSVIIQGLFLGILCTSSFELLIEITYPEQPMCVSMIATVVLGAFRLLYPFLGRVILEVSGSTASTSLSVAMMALCTFLIFFIKPDYKREEANKNTSLEMK